MLLWMIVGAGLAVVVLGLSVRHVVEGFRRSTRSGMAALAQLLAWAALAVIAAKVYGSYAAAEAQGLCAEATEKEAQQTIDELKNTENIDIGL